MNRRLWYAKLGCGAVILGIAAVNLFIDISTKPYIYDIADAPSAQTALVLGASVRSDGTLSPVFRARADAAIALYTAGEVSKILVSGDNSTVSHNEVNPTRIYLLQNGIPDEDIFLDHAGFDTYSSMYRARDIFGVDSMLVATQSFHLPRALFIARSLGLAAWGVRADTRGPQISKWIRELFANEKAVIEVVFHQQPKYLGDQIPITGDGREYP